MPIPILEWLVPPGHGAGDNSRCHHPALSAPSMKSISPGWGQHEMSKVLGNHRIWWLFQPEVPPSSPRMGQGMAGKTNPECPGHLQTPQTNCRAGIERNSSTSGIHGYTRWRFLHPSFIFGIKTPKFFWFLCTRAGPVRSPVSLGDKHQTLPKGSESGPELKDREQIREAAVGSGFLGTHPIPAPPGQDLTTFNPPQKPQPERIYQQIFFCDNISVLKREKNSHLN